DHVAIRGELAHDLRQGGEKDCADNGTEDIRGAADDREGQDLDGPRDAIFCGINVEIDMRLERSRVAGDDGADDESDHLVERNVNAVAGCRQLVFADGRPGLT